MMKHRQVLANLVEFKLKDFEEIDSPIKSLEDKTICLLIMDLRSKGGDKLYIAVERAWNRELALWAKKKFKTEAETHASCMAAWLHKIHRDLILVKLDPHLQERNIMFGCEHYWWLSMKYPALVLSVDYNLNVLSDLHKAMLPKLKVMRTFPIVMRSVLQFLGGLNLRRLEIEVIAQSLHHLISLYSTDTSACTLLKTLIEYHQLEVGSDK